MEEYLIDYDLGCCGDAAETDYGIDPLTIAYALYKAGKVTASVVQGSRARKAAQEAARIEQERLEAERIAAEQKAERQKYLLLVGGSVLIIGAIGYARVRDNE